MQMHAMPVAGGCISSTRRMKAGPLWSTTLHAHGHSPCCGPSAVRQSTATAYQQRAFGTDHARQHNSMKAILDSANVTTSNVSIQLTCRLHWADNRNKQRCAHACLCCLRSPQCCIQTAHVQCLPGSGLPVLGGSQDAAAITWPANDQKRRQPGLSMPGLSTSTNHSLALSPPDSCWRDAVPSLS